MTFFTTPVHDLSITKLVNGYFNNLLIMSIKLIFLLKVISETRPLSCRRYDDGRHSVGVNVLEHGAVVTDNITPNAFRRSLYMSKTNPVTIATERCMDLLSIHF